MKRSALLLAVGLTVAACASEPASRDPYLEDAAFRRATLVASLVNPDNGYSRLRLAHYESGDDADWSRLREWNPRVSVVAPAELDAPHGVDPSAPLAADARALDLPDAPDEAALVALGEQAFFRYPMQLEMTAPRAASSRDAFARYGFWTDDARGTPLVRVELDDGSRMLAFTCATCHVGTGMHVGAPNDALDLGRLAFDAGGDPITLGWGPGRVDVTTANGTEPVRIADLRPVRWLGWLQADGTVMRRDRASLAIRIETLVVTSHHEDVRPPRVVALALAAYVESLADSLPAPPAPPDVFVQNCAGCHAPPSYAGPPVALGVVGTDPHVGLSSDRGTGKYRVPSLHGVATRGALFHDASVRDLDALLDPARTGGHAFGLALADADRAALRGFLGGL